MFNLIAEGLKVQGLIADANHVTDAEAHAIKARGLRLVHRPKQVTCRCEAYKFPHRLDSLKCRELYNSSSDETCENYKAEIVRDFDREEARAINANR